ncbi:Cytoplasmic dynein 1 heavy chain 1 [Gracilariopsis chorda]|uniref:Dynein heavy chain, cytoplasmic n=1 Tax=Gracilariopsis chorda TaxID=448386 RepID=A0A2V3ING4_9FLOR|nr:Cytoplasmic dynein 1 heavy chain 1 [Gracilariopsis chorda]|eukprot:PXF43614.1 Cytoplasmic dynein 1 heavy chain 1 [Gracilariopsis chorda]
MDSSTAITTLSNLGFADSKQTVSNLEDGTTTLLKSSTGSIIALFRRGDKYDTLILGSNSDCPVPTLRAVLETAVLPLSDTYAAKVGVALPERDALRKRIREASVALDVIAKGRLFSVKPPEFPLHKEVKAFVEGGANSIDDVPDLFIDNHATLNQLQANVVTWSRSIDRIVQIAKEGPKSVLTIEEETVFWSSLDAALSSAQKALSSRAVKISLEILARKRRATAFLLEASSSIDGSRRKAAAVLTFLQGLPIISLRTAEDIQSLKKAVTTLMEHIAAKLRISSFSVERILSLIDAMASDVNRSLKRILEREDGLLTLPYEEFTNVFKACCDLFEAWSQGFDHCRKVAREAARKKGESMPPRRQSPLLRLHNHLTDIHDLRSDHQAIRTVLIDLASERKSPSRLVETLDQELTKLVDECKALNHFDLNSNGEMIWEEKRATYRSETARIEETLAENYSEIVKNAQSLGELAASLKGFECILGKQFMTIAVTEAVSSVINLGSKACKTLKERFRIMTERLDQDKVKRVVAVCSLVSESQLISRRISSLLAELQGVCGESNISILPEIKEFVVGVQRFAQIVNPSETILSWMKRVSVEDLRYPLFSASTDKGLVSVETSVSQETMNIFRVVRLVRDDHDLCSTISNKYFELARLCQSLFPVFTKIDEALECFNRVLWVLSQMEEVPFLRLYSIVEPEVQNASKLIEKGFQMKWNDSLRDLETYSSELLELCSSLCYGIQLLVESDQAMDKALKRFNTTRHRLTNGNMNDETKNFVSNGFHVFVGAKERLTNRFANLDFMNYLKSYWMPYIHESIMAFLENLRSAWLDALSTGDLMLPRAFVGISSSSSGARQISCSPAVFDLENLLYRSLGALYHAFVVALSTVEIFGLKEQRKLVCYILLVSHVRSSSYVPSDLKHRDPLSTIHVIRLQLCERLGQWNVYRSFLVFRGVSHVGSEPSLEELPPVLDLLTAHIEDVGRLHALPHSNASFSDHCIAMDCNALNNQIQNNLRKLLASISDQFARRAGGASQECYKDTSAALCVLKSASQTSGMENLLQLQRIKEMHLPRLRSTMNSLEVLERKFENISRRLKDNSFCKPKTTETWILSDSLRSHLEELSSVFEQRSQSILLNREALLKKYEEEINAYQSKLATLFEDFQTIRNDISGKEGFIESEVLVQDLEHQLSLLDNRGEELERIGKALGSSRLPERNSHAIVLDELRRVKDGIQRLSIIERSLRELSHKSFQDSDPVWIQEQLDGMQKEVEGISKATGARREANRLMEIIKKCRTANSFFTNLWSVKLSPPRERELLQRFFGQTYPEVSLGDTSLQLLWDINLSGHDAYLRGVLENAAGEAAICDFLNSIARVWTGRKCIFLSHFGIPVLQEIPDLLNDLDEHLQALETMRNSRHARLFDSERSMWERRLSECHESLELLVDVQSQWAHLRGLFGLDEKSDFVSRGLRVELREEFNIFSNVHARFMGVGKDLESAPGLLEGLEKVQGLQDMVAELKGVVRGLSKFLETQRSLFPRFFFLSDNDLLQVLSVSAGNLDSLSPHIGKLFPGLSCIICERKGTVTEISAVESKEGEVVALTDPVCVSERDSLTEWLTRVQDSIKESLKHLLTEGLQIFRLWYSEVSKAPFAAFIEQCLRIPAQMCLLASKAVFVETVEKGMRKQDTGRIYHQLTNDLSDLLSHLSEYRAITEASRKSEILRDQLVKELVYQRDLLRKLEKRDINNALVHVWDHEVRYYLSYRPGCNEVTNIHIRCASSEFVYGWEYLGMGDTLVHTNVTSRCFLTLSEALRKGYGGSPFGPAGTGKTETVKALGRMHGRFVAVFNCDESFDSVSVGRILAGVCRVGCWVCFDEFNRLSANILSSTSGQLASLQQAIRKGVNEIQNFYGGAIPIVIQAGVGIFVTMNPSYTGRRELPANLKSLFRPCSMSKPDSVSIAEVLLLINGFKTSTALSRKLTSMFESLGYVLGSQPHYDFGLRSLKSCVVACGNLIRTKVLGRNERLNSEFEENIIVQGVSEVLKPKLDMSDVADYEAIVSLTFTSATCLTPRLPEDIESNLLEAITELKLVQDSVMMEKTRQLYCLMQHQVGVMLVGPTGSGKSTAWRILYEGIKRYEFSRDSACYQENRKTRRSSVTIIDAKLLSMRQLYGYLDPLTREWTDGVFTKALRNISECTEDNLTCTFPLHWIIFDGDVDPDWVENLNSVLDDNRILTLPTGEQVPLLSNTRILFETHTLRHANPSTVSRCGMVCFGGHHGLEEVFCNSVLQIVNEYCRDDDLPSCLPSLGSSIVRLARNALQRFAYVMSAPLESLLCSYTVLLASSLRSFSMRYRRGVMEDCNANRTTSDLNISKHIILRIMLMTVVKAIGSGVCQADRRRMTEDLIESVANVDEILRSLSGVVIPSDFSNVNITADGHFVEHRELIPTQSQSLSENDIGSPDFVVPTSTTIRLESLLQDFLNNGTPQYSSISPLLLCGPPGCGKSMLLTTTLRKVPNTSIASLSFSSETKPESLLAALRGSTVISKRPNGSFVLHPKSAGCRVVLFCDEVNLEKPDAFETQNSICLLRSLAEHGGFWEGTPPRWVVVENIQIVAACNPEDNAGRYKLPERFLRHCTVISVEQPTFEDLNIIYGTFVESLLCRYHQQLRSKHADLTTAMVEYFKCNKEEFCSDRIGPVKPHYIYSPRELSRWIRGMTQILLSEHSEFKESFVSLDVPAETAWKNVTEAFIYEARRLFCDRLVTETERKFADSSLREIAMKYLDASGTNMSDVLFTSWTSEQPLCGARRVFKRIDNISGFRTLVYQRLRVFAEEEGLGGSWMSGNSTNKSDEWRAMIDQFAVTDDVLTHLTRIERVLCNPMGHAVLIGAPGTGKKTLSRFAAWMLSIEVHQVRSHSTYTEQDFAADLRLLLKKAALRNCHLLMIFDESHAMESGFLELMNSLLACGEVPGLFSGDERTSLLNDLRQATAGSSSVTSSEQSLYNEFVRRVRNNLHIIFTISAEIIGSEESESKRIWNMPGEDVSKRSPALYNRCTVDWIGDWARPTLEAVAELKIEVSHGHERGQIIRGAVSIHEISKKMYRELRSVAIVTPRHFLEFIEQLNRIALEKGNEIQAGVGRHTEGLRRLRYAGTAVDTLKDSLSQKAARLQVKEKDASEMLVRMAEEQRLAEKSKVDAEQLSLAASEASGAVQDREAEVSAKLAGVQPKVEAAREAVGSIRKEYLDELRAMPNPPPAVRVALEGVTMVLDASRRKVESQYSWGHIRAQMRSSEFISNIVNFNVDTISEGVRSKVEKKILQNPDFDVIRISYASKAAGPLAEWTLAVLDYAEVKESVEPLEAEVLELQNEQAELLEKQELAAEEVEIYQQRIDECKMEYAKLVADAENVRREIQDSKGNLTRAEEMLDSLADEWDRWVKELNHLNASAVTIWGNAMLGAAFVAYAGALDHRNRQLLMTEWKRILRKETMPLDERIEVAQYLTSAEERGLWSSLGLATDNTSLENFAILKRAARFPLIVDPTRRSGKLLGRVLCTSFSENDGYGSRSFDSSHAHLNISETTFASTGKKSYMRTLESAMRFGTSLLVDEAEKFDRAVTPLLGQESSYSSSAEYVQTLSSSSRKKEAHKSRKSVCQRVVRLGDKDVFLNSSFRLYLSTANLKSVPRCAVTRSNVVSFELSSAALQNSCVSRAVEILAPELGEKKRSSLAAEVKYQQRKRVLEDMLLSTVNKVDDIGAELLRGSLLDDLSNLKNEVRQIERRRREEDQASRAISHKEHMFAPLGTTSVKIYEVLRSLVDVFALYRFTSSYFLQVFENAMLGCRGIIKRQSDEEHVSECERVLQDMVYARTAASLFPGDRVPFAATLSLLISDQGIASNSQGRMQSLREAWQLCLNSSYVSKLQSSGQGKKTFEKLPSAFQKVLEERHINSDEGELDPMKIGMQVLYRIVYEPLRTYDSIGDLACTLPGGKELIHGEHAGPESAFKHILDDFLDEQKLPPSSMFQPLLLCSRGENSDPALFVSEMASRSQIYLVSLAMGSSDTEQEVVNLMSHASRRALAGTRMLVLLKNMHLASKATINKVHALLGSTGKLPFLLVMVAEVPFSSPPPSVLNMASISNFFSFEAPRSFLSSITRALECLESMRDPKTSEEMEDQLMKAGMQILLSWLHACLTERSRNSPIGFSKAYDFSESDLVAGWELTSKVSSELHFHVAISNLAHLLKTTVYGCRMETPTDQEILDALVDDILSLERIRSISTGNISVFSETDDSEAMQIPIERAQRESFFQSLPLEVNPQWYYMPSATTRERRVSEGRCAVEKVLQMSRDAFQPDPGVASFNTPVLEEAHSNVEAILRQAIRLPNVWFEEPTDFASKSPLRRFWNTEKATLSGAIEAIKGAATDLLHPEKVSPKRMVVLSVFKEELSIICSTASQKVPYLWTDACSLFGKRIAAPAVFSRILRCVDNLPDGNRQKSIDLSSVLRPRAFLAALRFERALERDVPAHILQPYVTVDEQASEGACLLTGLRLTGACWNASKNRFVLNDEFSDNLGTVKLSWREVEDIDEDRHTIDLPLYATLRSASLIETVHIQIESKASHRLWRLRGVSFSVNR